MNKSIIISVVFGIVIFFSNCEKQSSAGLGGNATLSIQGQHHGSKIDSLVVYIKFNSSDAPSDDTYDLNQQVNTSGLARFDGLKAGKYYLFAKGYDPSISKEVKGGIPFQIKDEKAYDVVVPVTENH
jgi:hypothetical protein